jgi:ribokinase
MKPTFLAIGDTVCDAFIELSDAHITKNDKTGENEISMRFGDKLPFVADYLLYGVGNSPNAAVSASRLGLVSSLLTHIGIDMNGRLSMQSLADNNVDTTMVITQADVKTNYHYVLWFRPERTILVKHEHYQYDFPREIAKLTTNPDWIYLSSIGGGTQQYHTDISSWLGKNRKTKLVFQPGTFQIELGVTALTDIYDQTELFFCNVEESVRILSSAGYTIPYSDDKTDYVKNLMKGLYVLGPRVIVVTDGPNGAYSYDGTDYRYCPMYPDTAPPVERTGAGDAYASTFAAYYAQGLSISECMLRAPINSMSVVQHVGAQEGLLDDIKISQYLASAPTNYIINEI